MVQVVFVDSSGREQVVSARGGFTLMEVAVANGVDGIRADCGGACSCATCHVLVDPTWLDRISVVKAFEEDLLESLDNRAPNSRLSCQISVDDHLEGLRVSVPAAA
jgi:2Fe-2S ferredoxin